MDVAFVENAENDVTGDESRENQERLARQGGLESLCRALKTCIDRNWHADFTLGRIDGIHGVAQRDIRSSVKRKGYDRKLALVIHGESRRLLLEAGKRAQWNLRPVRGLHVDNFQRVWVLRELSIDLQHDVILIQLGEHRGDLPLTERVVERFVNGLRKNAKARGGVAVNDEIGFKALVLLVGGDVAKLRK